MGPASECSVSVLIGAEETGEGEDGKRPPAGFKPSKAGVAALKEGDPGRDQPAGWMGGADRSVPASSPAQWATQPPAGVGTQA